MKWLFQIGHGALLVAWLLSGNPLPAADTIRYDLQAGLAFPSSNDLKVTTGSGLNPCLGAYLAQDLPGNQTVRAGLDFGWFTQGTRASDASGLKQTVLTRVRSMGLGMEYLYRPALPMLHGRWSVGAGLHLIRWTVDSTNELVLPNGAFSPSGTSTWTRAGLGGVLGYRLSRHLEAEARILFSHYGYENQPADVTSLDLLYHF